VGPGREVLGTADLPEAWRSADALINLTGATVLQEEHMQVPVRAYLETDPVLPQIEVAEGREFTIEMLAAHTHHFTFGELIGRTGCEVPTGRFDYVPTRQPVDLDLWPVAFDPAARSYTTIGNWKQAGHDVVWRGETYCWSKHHEFLKFLDLPRRRPRQHFELAINIDDEADRERLRAHGWAITSPLAASLDPWTYQAFFGASRAEWTVAKDQNVRLRSGWFSERAACYLATGKPVVTQSTGFENVLPTGTGLFGFRDMDEIVGAIETIEADYPAACRAARGIAEEYLEASRVCRKLLEDIAL
jgi:hypothetical protein